MWTELLGCAALVISGAALMCFILEAARDCRTSWLVILGLGFALNFTNGLLWVLLT